ncbi:SDR family oxidoreductase [Paraburkholderia caballeronis]|uniref:Nucleoside-diphosphate-sugar epimerase n=1 Tax=Paraburkholderia caballeronis TaxID=416943 RepID=A0A1H7G2T9_9BURK|nr:SDR family oxidoreductase [Paraburkholderia caballeronis]PXW24737.1 nucleoside-diphosphate-sugar epimerase [Paraburkholderia caballeronis]PXX00467.1 nucleoside-diphosphate-sugar epimerase [Paraburkholderia caballeronis]RAJ98530.1 nucleoside-diphosphate-sugar epimerase [Paraburkholderia caballeronis]SEE66153.1 Nucleoside-diphosphate-sugar epimerase [Paraburkholderia caballeronis]SEK32421.1 Nucleoside-diphosphate-sugar epimerase [Paraburkholderia caballeronis]
MTNRNKALVAGGLGVIGRQLVTHLAALPDWEPIGLSRRAPEPGANAQYIAVDLLDPDDVRAKLGDLHDVTHIFHAAYQEQPSPQALIDVNLRMLRNLVEVVADASPALRRIVLYQGAKYYGAHLGRFSTPAREDDPRHMPPDFYYDMQDWLLAEAAGKPWDATILRPDVVCGFALGNPMNLSMLIAVYASISKELGLPLRFPGTAACYEKLAQVTDAAQLARGSVWAATAAPGGESYNLTNGDLFRWNQLWPAIARYFDMPLAEPQTLTLREQMADKGPLWTRMTAKYGLAPVPYERVAAWAFGDFIFRCDWDVISSTTKIRQAGFHDVVDSTPMFLRLFDEFRARKAIP